MTFILLLGFLGTLLAQKTVTGKVTDIDKNPLAGVSVVVKGTTTGSLTNAEGTFSLAIPADAKTLAFTYIGMRPFETEIGNLVIFDVTMQVETSLLDEVIVVGYGTMRKKDLTGSVSSVKPAALENQKPQSVQDILRGNVAGLSVGFATNAKGGGALEIRGDNTLKTNSTPLIVLDGVIYQGGMEDINPNDIETIDVLKDAS